MKISVIIPAYNEEKIIDANLRAMASFLGENFDCFELLLVNDGSVDRTYEIAQAVAASNPNVRVISCLGHLGKGNAVREGIMRSTGDLIVFTDADLAYPPQYIPYCVRALEQCNIAIGSRYLSGVNSTEKGSSGYKNSRMLASRIFVWFANFVLGLNLTDIQCGIKGFQADVAKEIAENSKIAGFGFDAEFLCIAKEKQYTILEFPVRMCENSEIRPSRVRIIRDGLKMFANVLALKWQF
ncbi:MAG: glycosyltransferase [Clostridiales bacterium]|jgi:glycosyltransferase involved in cell wall biosynthesis|nr:glycosyltransferase [Clostridiales bacterium]